MLNRSRRRRNLLLNSQSFCFSDLIFSADFKGVIDYIFYSKAHMNTLGLLGPLDPEWIKDNKIVGCPHPYLPSDHFCLLSEFEMPLQSGGNNQSNQLSNGVLRR